MTPAALYKRQEGGPFQGYFLGTPALPGNFLAWCCTRPLQNPAVSALGVCSRGQITSRQKWMLCSLPRHLLSDERPVDDTACPWLPPVSQRTPAIGSRVLLSAWTWTTTDSMDWLCYVNAGLGHVERRDWTGLRCMTAALHVRLQFAGGVLQSPQHMTAETPPLFARRPLVA